MRKLGTTTLGSFVSDILAECQLLTSETITPKLVKGRIYNAITEFQLIAGALDLDDYKESQVLTIGASKGIIIPSTGDYNSSTKILTLNLDIANWINCSPGLNDSFLNAVVTLIDLTGGIHFGNVDAIVDTTHAKLKIDAGNIGDGEIAGSIVVQNLSAMTFDIGAYSWYPNIDQLIMIEDTVNGPWDKKNQQQVAGIFKPGAENDNYSESIFWFRVGDKIYAKKGSDISSIGTIYMTWSRRPLKPVLKTDLMDVQDSSIRHLKTIVKYDVLSALKNPIVPAELREAYNTLMKAKAAQMNEEPSAVKNKDK